MKGYDKTAIFYDRRFLKVDKYYVPLVQIGYPNLLDWSVDGHQVIRKEWEILGFKDHGIIMFTEDELMKWFSNIDCRSVHRKNTCNYHDDFVRWLINGMKSARSIEDNIFAGNRLSMTAQDKTIYFSSKAELYYLMNECPQITRLGFVDDEYCSLRNVIAEKDLKDGIYVLSMDTEEERFIYSERKATGFIGIAKKFHNEQDAIHYAKKTQRYWRRKLTVEYFTKEEYLEEIKQ